MSAVILVCGKVFDGVPDRLMEPVEVLVEDGVITEIDRSVRWPSANAPISLPWPVILSRISVLPPALIL